MNGGSHHLSRRVLVLFALLVAALQGCQTVRPQPLPTTVIGIPYDSQFSGWMWDFCHQRFVIPEALDCGQIGGGVYVVKFRSVTTIEGEALPGKYRILVTHNDLIIGPKYKGRWVLPLTDTPAAMQQEGLPSFVSLRWQTVCSPAGELPLKVLSNEGRVKCIALVNNSEGNNDAE